MSWHWRAVFSVCSYKCIMRLLQPTVRAAFVASITTTMLLKMLINVNIFTTTEIGCVVGSDFHFRIIFIVINSFLSLSLCVDTATALSTILRFYRFDKYQRTVYNTSRLIN